MMRGNQTMIWTNEKPSRPGLYWYRDHQNSQLDDYRPVMVLWNSGAKMWVARTFECNEISVSDYQGEWYGPITPPANIAESCNKNVNPCNTRILIKLQHGGSFYVEKILPEEIALSLSERLKAIRRRGNSIPLGIRSKIGGVIHELIDFARAPLKNN